MISIRESIEKASRMDLTTGLFGRTLSEEDMRKARENFKEDVMESEFLGIKICREYSVRGDEFVVDRVTYVWTTTEDSSRGLASSHTGYYHSKRVTSRYNGEGNLKEREIHGKARVTFNPPGSIIGDRVSVRKMKRDFLRNYLEQTEGETQ